MKNYNLFSGLILFLLLSCTGNEIIDENQEELSAETRFAIENRQPQTNTSCSNNVNLFKNSGSVTPKEGYCENINSSCYDEINKNFANKKIEFNLENLVFCKNIESKCFTETLLKYSIDEKTKLQKGPEDKFSAKNLSLIFQECQEKLKENNIGGVEIFAEDLKGKKISEFFQNSITDLKNYYIGKNLDNTKPIHVKIINGIKNNKVVSSLGARFFLSNSSKEKYQTSDADNKPVTVTAKSQLSDYIDFINRGNKEIEIKELARIVSFRIVNLGSFNDKKEVEYKGSLTLSLSNGKSRTFMVLDNEGKNPKTISIKGLFGSENPTITAILFDKWISKVKFTDNENNSKTLSYLMDNSEFLNVINQNYSKVEIYLTADSSLKKSYPIYNCPKKMEGNAVSLFITENEIADEGKCFYFGTYNKNPDIAQGFFNLSGPAQNNFKKARIKLDENHFAIFCKEPISEINSKNIYQKLIENYETEADFKKYKVNKQLNCQIEYLKDKDFTYQYRDLTENLDFQFFAILPQFSETNQIFQNECKQNPDKNEFLFYSEEDFNKSCASPKAFIISINDKNRFSKDLLNKIASVNYKITSDYFGLACEFLILGNDYYDLFERLEYDKTGGYLKFKDGFSNDYQKKSCRIIQTQYEASASLAKAKDILVDSTAAISDSPLLIKNLDAFALFKKEDFKYTPPDIFEFSQKRDVLYPKDGKLELNRSEKTEEGIKFSNSSAVIKFSSDPNNNKINSIFAVITPERLQNTENAVILSLSNVDGNCDSKSELFSLKIGKNNNNKNTFVLSVNTEDNNSIEIKNNLAIENKKYVFIGVIDAYYGRLIAYIYDLSNSSDLKLIDTKIISGLLLNNSKILNLTNTLFLGTSCKPNSNSAFNGKIDEILFYSKAFNSELYENEDIKSILEGLRSLRGNF